MTPTQWKLWALGIACIIAVFVCINNTMPGRGERDDGAGMKRDDWRDLALALVITALMCWPVGCAMRADVAALEADKRRLDHLQVLGEKAAPMNPGWLVRESTTHRGMRLQQTSREGNKPTVREAIDDSMESGA